MTPREWEAQSYDRLAAPMTGWGMEVLQRLELTGGERVLDAGCGTGRVTEALRLRLPRGRVVALDGSAAMLAEARERLGDEGVEYVRADLGRPLPVDPVDAVLSTATFHWVADHDALFTNLAAVLRPGGQLVAQCGGAGNIASVVEVLARVGDGWRGPWRFAGAEETQARLEANGFVGVRTWLEARCVTFEAAPVLEEYLATVVLGDHLARLAPDDRPAFTAEVVRHLERPEIDYVRLNMVARRA